MTVRASRSGYGTAMSGWWQDLLYAVRQFRRAPLFTGVAVLTLALGIGANTAIFSVVRRLLLQPLPYPDGDRIVMLSSAPEDGARTPSVATLRAVSARSRLLEVVAAARVEGVAVQEDDGQDTVYAMVTPNFMQMLGVAPAMGRTFTVAEGAGQGEPVAMISHSRWQREFGGRANAVGSTVEVNYHGQGGAERRRYTIVGVTPPTMSLPMSPASFNKNLRGPKPGVWLPFDLSRERSEDRPFTYARLRAGVSVVRATQELQGIIDSSPELGAQRYQVRLLRAQDLLDPTHTRMIGVLFAAVGVLLLISCANVASLLMSRAWARRREFAVRAALGSGRARLARQVLIESTVLAMIGGLVGVGIAWLTLRFSIALRPPDLATLDTVHLESAVLLWSAGIAVLTGLVFGTLPAMFAARGSVSDVLRADSRGGSTSVATRQVRSALIVVEIALSVVLLIGAGLLARSFLALQRMPLGFEPRGLVSFDAILSPEVPRELRAGYRNSIVERLRAVPGVTDAGMGMMPAAGFGALQRLSAPADPNGFERSVPEFSVIFASSNYFRLAGIRLIEGRPPDSLSAALQVGARSAPTEVVVNRSLASRFWPNGGALGARIREGDDPSSTRDYLVVGVAEDVRVPGPNRLARDAVLYMAPRLPSFIVRTSLPVADLLPALRRAIAATRPTPFIQTTTIGEIFVRDSLAPTRFAMGLLAAFAVVALVLSGVGLYSVIAYGVTQRTREIGVRVALGAQSSAVTRLVMLSGVRLTVAGLLVGVAAALAATRVLAGLLYGVSAVDPLTFAGISLLVVGISLVASYVPSRLATRIDAAQLLRWE